MSGKRRFSLTKPFKVMKPLRLFSKAMSQHKISAATLQEAVSEFSAKLNSIIPKIDGPSTFLPFISDIDVIVDFNQLYAGRIFELLAEQFREYAQGGAWRSRMAQISYAAKERNFVSANMKFFKMYRASYSSVEVVR